VTASFYFTPEERTRLKALLQTNEREAQILIETRFRELETRRQNSEEDAVRRALRDAEYVSALQKIGAGNKGKGKGKGKKSKCQCKCDPGEIDFAAAGLSGGGYGKYCGAGYSCKTRDDSCDVFDACCRIHDACIGKSGYCDSCDCNVALANCVFNTSTTDRGFAPCYKGQEARGDILDDICFAIEDAPRVCGGCDDAKDHPASCADSYASLSALPLPLPLLLSVLIVISLPFL